VGRAGGRLEALDGHQLAAAYSSAPTAAGAGVVTAWRDGMAS
jgi:hypothetical protein